MLTLNQKLPRLRQSVIDKKPVKFKYKNWKGETKKRHVLPLEVYYGSTEYHKTNQWLLKGIDLSKKQERVFAVDDISKFY